MRLAVLVNAIFSRNHTLTLYAVQIIHNECIVHLHIVSLLVYYTLVHSLFHMMRRFMDCGRGFRSRRIGFCRFRHGLFIFRFRGR